MYFEQFFTHLLCFNSECILSNLDVGHNPPGALIGTIKKLQSGYIAGTRQIISYYICNVIKIMIGCSALMLPANWLPLLDGNLLSIIHIGGEIMQLTQFTMKCRETCYVHYLLFVNIILTKGENWYM